MKRFAIFLPVILFILPVLTFGQEKTNVTPDAAELAKLKQAIEQNPEDLSAHEAYVKAVGFTKWGAAEDEDFIRQYEAWMKKFPRSATVAYAFGHAWAGRESPKAKPYLLKAVEIDPKYDKAWFDLWIDGERWGDFKLSNSYLLKAKKANPKSADYAFYYANSYSKSNYKKYKKLSLKVARDFPGTERGAQALYWLANRTTDDKEKIKIYELQKKNFPVQQFNWSSSGMSEYYYTLLRTAPEQAIKLAEEVAAAKGKEARDIKTWETNIQTARQIAEAEHLLAAGKGVEAAALTEKIQVPRFGSAKEYILFLKARSLDAAGKTGDAYQTLMNAYVKEPAPAVLDQLVVMGNKIGKDVAAVNADTWYVRDTAAKQAPVFNLENYYSKSFTSLNDYRGKVVLLTYWFPGCGPCRGEFPHFQNVVDKFRDRSDFVYVGINIVAEQDDYVLPFMQSSGYSFIPLKDNDKWEKGPLNNRNAAPVNFLIDQDGKIIFSNFRTDAHNEATLEMMIRSMLEKRKTI